MKTSSTEIQERFCKCGCGKVLPERAEKRTRYIQGHQPQNPCRTPEFRAKMTEIQRTRRANGWTIAKEATMRGVRKAQQTKAERKAAGKKYSYSVAKGYKQPPETVERRAAALRGRPQTHPLTAAGPANKQSCSGMLRSPDNITYRYRNLTHFVREHEHLFAPEDVVQRFTPAGQPWCRAAAGLLNLRSKRANGHWKGWTLVSLTETFYNKGKSLLTPVESNQTEEPAGQQ